MPCLITELNQIKNGMRCAKKAAYEAPFETAREVPGAAVICTVVSPLVQAD
jgi:hypothetical protein